jgi:hypothetical protein
VLGRIQHILLLMNKDRIVLFKLCPSRFNIWAACVEVHPVVMRMMSMTEPCCMRSLVDAELDLDKGGVQQLELIEAHARQGCLVSSQMISIHLVVSLLSGRTKF